jgi:uncharacterized membrane protein
MERMEHSEIIDRPLSTVYNQWTQAEEFPRFMEGVKSVRQLDNTHQEWHAEIAGKDVHWQAEIIDQVPDQRIVWRSTSGVKNGGMVQFKEVEPGRTEVTLVMEYEPEGAVQKIGDAVGVPDARVKGDLKRFKEYIESQPAETGAWRGEVHRGQEQTGPRTTS